MAYRTLCEILEEARKCNETRNFSYLPGIIEELQNAGNRMEAALWAQKDITRLNEEVKELKKSKEELKTEIQKLEEKKSELTGQPVPESKKKSPNTYPFWED